MLLHNEKVMKDLKKKSKSTNFYLQIGATKQNEDPRYVQKAEIIFKKYI